jgi:hypothetical protein
MIIPVVAMRNEIRIRRTYFFNRVGHIYSHLIGQPDQIANDVHKAISHYSATNPGKPSWECGDALSPLRETRNTERTGDEMANQDAEIGHQVSCCHLTVKRQLSLKGVALE